jgi:phage shock protein A
MLEKTPLGETSYDQAFSDYLKWLEQHVSQLEEDVAKLKIRIVELEGQLRWTEMELSRHF